MSTTSETRERDAAGPRRIQERSRAVEESVWVLDGAMGTELRARGVEVPDHITSIWSAKALLDAPDAVEAAHRAYIEAGADVITLNNYAVTRPLLAREGLEGRFEELTDKAVALGCRARDAANKEVRIAASIPPLATSYRAEQVGEDREILEQYREMTTRLAPHADILLCETLSSAREARAAATAACETGRVVWLSWTLQGQHPDHLPSGEHLGAAFDAIEDLPVSAYLVNCCGANFVTRAMPILAARTDRPVGGYANTADVIPALDDDADVAPEDVPRRLLDVEGYAQAAQSWIAAGARIVGGCCSTGPSHIRRLRALVDER